MRKAVCILLSVLVAFPLISLVASAGDKPVEVLSAEWDGENPVYTVVFSDPVHIFKDGWVWLRGNNATDGEGQQGLIAVRYTGETTEKDGLKYSQTLELTFPAFEGNEYGISIVEYFLDDSNEGFVSPEVIRGENGEMLKGNFESGGLDFCWIPIESHPSAPDLTVVIKTAENNNQDPEEQQKGRDLNIQNKKLYSFMNCDTGRMLTCDGQTEFRIIDEGDGKYSLRTRNGEKYLCFDNEKLSFSDTPFFFSLFIGNDYQRVRISLPDGSGLADDDKGETAEANVVKTGAKNNDISTGWYMTLYGDPLPMRVAMVGDSITNGCTPDGEQPKAGCRAELSAALIEKYGRVVFVGSAVASHGGDGSGGARSTVNDAFLYREEGHNGWVVTSQDGYAPANNYGIDTLIPNLMTKYRPDAICMMIGINDIAQVGYNYVMDSESVKGQAYWERWKKLANDILLLLPENGRLVIGTYTPQTLNGEWNKVREKQLRQINKMLSGIVDGLHGSDPRISLTDNYLYVLNVGPEACSSDGVHLSAEGYTAMAESYYDALIKVCDGITARTVTPDEYGQNNHKPEPGSETPKWLVPAIVAAAVVAAAVTTVFIVKRKK